jgi:ribosome-associated protein
VDRAGTSATLDTVDTDDLRTPGGLTVPREALAWTFARASGPGGQNVNKTATRVTLAVDVDAVCGPSAAVERMRRLLPDGVRVTSQTTRSQWRNRQECLLRAADLLDTAARPPAPTRRPSKPTRGSIERRLDSKRRVGEKKVARRTTEW